MAGVRGGDRPDGDSQYILMGRKRLRRVMFCGSLLCIPSTEVVTSTVEVESMLLMVMVQVVNGGAMKTSDKSEK